MACDVGTHIDAPSHWFPDGRDISQLKPEELICPGVVIDISDSKIKDNPDYALTLQDVLDWED